MNLFFFFFNLQIVVVPIIQNFGIVYRDKLATMGLRAADISLVINTNCACSMILGLFNGPIYRKFGYRKVSWCAGVGFTLGMIASAFTTTFLMFLITYGFIVG